MLVAANVDHWFTTIFVPEAEMRRVDPEKPIVLKLDGPLRSRRKQHISCSHFM